MNKQQQFSKFKLLFLGGKFLEHFYQLPTIVFHTTFKHHGVETSFQRQGGQESPCFYGM
jgi:hypothetical protein